MVKERDKVFGLAFHNKPDNNKDSSANLSLRVCVCGIPIYINRCQLSSLKTDAVSVLPWKQSVTGLTIDPLAE